MLEPKLPVEVTKLRPSRRMIITEYYRLRSNGSVLSVNRTISNNLGYKITNGKNSFVERVIRDFFRSHTYRG